MVGDTPVVGAYLLVWAFLNSFFVQLINNMKLIHLHFHCFAAFLVCTYLVWYVLDGMMMPVNIGVVSHEFNNELWSFMWCWEMGMCHHHYSRVSMFWISSLYYFALWCAMLNWNNAQIMKFKHVIILSVLVLFFFYFVNMWN